MKKRPLEYGEVLRARINYDERGDSRFFNSDRFAKVYEAEVNKRLEASMMKCRDCPHCKMVIKQEENHALLEKFVEGKAFCEVTVERKSSCPVKFPDSGYMSTPTSRGLPDWVLDAERDAETSRVFSTPRGRGKSFIDKAMKESTITGKSASYVFMDEVDEPKVSMVGWDEMTANINEEQDLDEVVEFETNRSKYDNFGSW